MLIILSLVSSLQLLSMGSHRARTSLNVGEWHLYIDKNELRWVLSRLHITVAAHNYPVLVDLLVVGTVPAGCRPLSFTAVITPTLASLAANDRLGNITNHAAVEMAIGKREICRSKQRRLDQAVSVISLPASTSYVTFYPDLVLARLGVTSEKFVHARMCSNLRAVILAAARILARHLDADVGPCRKVVSVECWEQGGQDHSKLRVALEKRLTTSGN
ncbi:hypothetical protein EDB87DRAFT_1580937 [Lactarius vividus]|nr:hypothetical protein EDB87DRAFT_1580937 [Lactarius vividus]